MSAPFRSSSENICHERDLYANRAMKPTDPGALFTEQKFFSDVDDRAASAHAKLLKGEHMDGAEGSDWARFLMSLFFRQPQELARLRVRSEREWAHILRRNHPDLDEDLKYGLKKYETRFQEAAAVDAEDLALGTLKRVVDSERIGNRIIRMHWVVHTLDESAGSFLTGDIPTIRTEKLIGDDASIILPLSPQKVFIATASTKAFQGLDQLPSKEVRRRINIDVVTFARQYIVATDDQQTRFIRNHRD